MILLSNEVHSNCVCLLLLSNITCCINIECDVSGLCLSAFYNFDAMLRIQTDFKVDFCVKTNLKDYGNVLPALLPRKAHTVQVIYQTLVGHIVTKWGKLSQCVKLPQQI